MADTLKLSGFTHPKDLPAKLTPEYLLGKFVLCPHCNQLLAIKEVGDRQVGQDPHDHTRKGFYIVKLSDGAFARMWESM